MTSDYEQALVRHEEELKVDTRQVPSGGVNVRKAVESEDVALPLPRRVEYVDGYDVQAAQPHDSGQIETLSDGSVSIPIFEERLVVSKQLIVKERVIVRKKTVTEQQLIETTLQKERVDIESEGPVQDDLEGELR